MPQRTKKSLRRIKTIKTAKPEAFSSETFEDVQISKNPLSIKRVAFGLGLVLLVLLIYYYKNLFESLFFKLVFCLFYLLFSLIIF